MDKWTRMSTAQIQTMSMSRICSRYAKATQMNRRTAHPTQMLVRSVTSGYQFHVVLDDTSRLMCTRDERFTQIVAFRLVVVGVIVACVAFMCACCTVRRRSKDMWELRRRRDMIRRTQVNDS